MHILKYLLCLLIPGLVLFSACSSSESATDGNRTPQTTGDQPQPQQQEIQGVVYERVVSVDNDTTYRVLPGAFVRIFDSEMFHGNRSYSADRQGRIYLPTSEFNLGETYTVEVRDGSGSIGTQKFNYTQSYKESLLESGFYIAINQNIMVEGDSTGTREVELLIGDPPRVRIGNEP